MSYNEGTTMKKVSAAWIGAVFVMGVVVGALGGALLVTREVSRFEADAMTLAVLDTTASQVSILAAFNEENFEKQMNLIESAARIHLISGLLTLHLNMPVLSDEKRQTVRGTLKFIAINREKLKIGRFSEPPSDHIEKILASYAD